LKVRKQRKDVENMPENRKNSTLKWSGFLEGLVQANTKKFDEAAFFYQNV